MSSPIQRPNTLSTTYCLLVIALTSMLDARAQEIPLGTWRLHLSYHAVNSIAVADDKVFAATENGIVVYHLDDHNLSTINTLNGLTSTGITFSAYDKATDQLLVAYEDGGLDILRDDLVVNFERIKDSNAITGSRRINHIAVRNGLAYLSTDFGIVVFDLINVDLRETWRDLGESGVLLKVNKTTFLGDSIFAATDDGVIGGKLSDNLLDFNQWRRFNSGDLNSQVSSVESFGGSVVAAINGNGLFKKMNGQWEKLAHPQLDNLNFTSVNTAGSNLLIADGTSLWELTSSGALGQIQNGYLLSPQMAARDGANRLWVADGRSGLVSNVSGELLPYVPNGPITDQVFRLKYVNDKLYALPGGFTLNAEPINRTGYLSSFDHGSWSSIQTTVNDITDIGYLNGHLFIASFGDGIEVIDASSGETVRVIDEEGTDLVNLDPMGSDVRISALEVYGGLLWVCNVGSPLLRYDPAQDSWATFSSTSFNYDIRADGQGIFWMPVFHNYGGGINVADPAADANATLTIDNAGLPDNLVQSIDVDREDVVWVGTEEGVVYFFSSEEPALRPIFENRFLLQNENITAIKTDGGNRKWIGTERGVWLFNPTGEELIHNFTVENSPLLSNHILAIEIHPKTGEVFFASDKGIISYRSDATASDATFGRMKIFPNPVRSDFTGVVGISGLATDAEVKITDVSGKLIWQSHAQGGTATWNVRDYNGRRAARGVYLVFAATENGGESMVGKIAVVD